MNVFFHCIHGLTSFDWIVDLAVAVKAAGYNVGIGLGGRALRRDLCTRECSRLGLPIVDQSIFQANIMFVTDMGGWDRSSGQEIVIDVGHGMASKDRYYLPTSPYHSNHVLVPGPYYLDRIGPRDGVEFLAMGVPRLDRVFLELERRAIRATFLKHVLVLPTFNEGVNCMEELTNRDSPHRLVWDVTTTQVRIRPHPFFYESEYPPHVIWREWFDARPDLLSPNWSLSDDLIWAGRRGRVISDISSAGIEAMVCGIPTTKTVPRSPHEIYGDEPGLLANPGASIPTILDWMKRFG